ncbi:MAG: hypothetical protein DWH91_17825 [Planctomycetota bacterium]|nr:MAG: hypothetical protein DWH91_17825 [Planctomycetota bacterium]
MLAVGGLAALFFGIGLIRAPIPGVNESHYLGKARHFWQPDWCAGDLFLESANPHAVFYAAFGWLTTRWSLSEVALILRAGQCLILAAGWVALGQRVTGSLGRTLIAATLFLLWQASGTWSGEWLVGGAESKVWAYGGLLLSAAWGLEGRWNRSALAAGFAISLHPVVGCWGLIIAGIAWGISRLEALRNPSAQPLARTEPTAPRTVLITGMLLIAAALPGLIPAVQSLSAPSPEVAREADYLQVAVRLPHHLDPLTFPVRAWRDYLLLVLVWSLLKKQPLSQPPAQSLQGNLWIERWMLASLLVALGGLIAAWGPRPFQEMPFWALRAKLLKLYPFRLGDMLVPITVAFSAAAALWPTTSMNLRRKVLVSLLSLGALYATFRLPIPDRILATQPAAIQSDWLAASAWIRQHTPEDAVVQAIHDNWALRWYAERSEYFHFKDCPQDPASIVEWNRRYQLINQWKLKTFSDGRGSQIELNDLSHQTGIQYLLCFAYTPMESQPVFASPYFRVYRIESTTIAGPTPAP